MSHNINSNGESIFLVKDSRAHVDLLEAGWYQQEAQGDFVLLTFSTQSRLFDDYCKCKFDYTVLDGHCVSCQKPV